MKHAWWILGGAVLVAAGVLLIPIDTAPTPAEVKPVSLATDLSPFSAERLEDAPRLLFIHHSCGGQLFADRGPEKGEQCIYESHDNGGGLRRRLVEQGYAVHEASYGSLVGDKTDIFDWLPKFSQQMEQVLRVEHQDRLFEDERRNEIVAFKSCFPNNGFVALGEEPGRPAGPELTVANAKAAYRALLPIFAQHPDVLFVAFTAPALAGPPDSRPLWKVVARKVLGKKDPAHGPLARQFNSWMVAKDGWLAGYEGRNVVVFDYYDILTKHGESDYSKYPSGNGFDSHPNHLGNTAAAERFVPFLNRAVRRHRAKL